jgi:alpha-L-arabinofuranosidase
VLSSIAVGANTAAWDSNLTDAEIPRLLSNAGLQVLRYPGGSTSNNYHWLSNTPDDPNQGGTVPESNFDAFMSVIRTTGAQAMVTVNYGSGTAEEAADWVRYANRGGHHYNGPVPTYPGANSSGHNYGIKYWELGNETYGDGTYGATWEVNHNAHDPTTYASGVVNFSTAMKAVDPSIKLGVVLTAPGNWPDGQTSASSPQPWNDTVLPITCHAIDFVIVHWYAQGPTGESDAALLASPQNGEATSVSYTPSIPSMVTSLKALLTQYCGARASAIQIMITETNSVSYNPGKQTTSLVNALFLTDQVMTWLENGVANVDWWAVHNSPFDGNVSSSLYGSYDFGDYGILSRGFTTANGAV